jgi:hypothetical protein
MAKRRETHPFDDNPFVVGLFEYMDSPEGQRSIEVSDALWEVMDNAQLDAGRRLFLWPEGQRLSFDQSIERLQKQNPDFPREHIASFLISWVENHAPEDYSQAQLDELDRLTEEWIDELERQHMAK